MTKELLASLRGFGFEFDDGWDKLAKPDTKKILGIKVVSANYDETHLTIEAYLKTESLESLNATIFLTPYISIFQLGTVSIPLRITLLNNKTYSEILKFPLDNIFVTNYLTFKLHISCDSLSSESEMFQIKYKQEKEKPKAKATIVLDPGHGYTKNSTGGAAFIYTHKIMGKDGEPEIDEKNNFKSEIHDVTTLPEYVIDDPNKWVISKKEDPNRNERGLVFDVAQGLKILLEEASFTCFLTRNDRVIKGIDNAKTRKARIDLANIDKADYYISIHADSVVGNTASGAHVIYPKTSDLELRKRCIELGVDIYSNYNVVNVEKNSPLEDVRHLQVLQPANKTSRQVLVELGFLSTPKDARLLFMNIDRIAAQLFQGLLININKNFK